MDNDCTFKKENVCKSSALSVCEGSLAFKKFTFFGYSRTATFYVVNEENFLPKEHFRHKTNESQGVFDAMNSFQSPKTKKLFVPFNSQNESL